MNELGVMLLYPHTMLNVQQMCTASHHMTRVRRLTFLFACCRYQDYQASDIPTVEQNGVKVRVMAGRHQGTTGPIVMRNPGLLMDVTVSKGATFSQEVRTGTGMHQKFGAGMHSHFGAGMH